MKAYAARNAEKRKQLREGSGSALNRLRRYFDSLNRIGEASEYSRGCLLGNFAAELSAQSAAVREGVQGAFDEWTTLVAGVIAEAQRDGSVARDVPAKVLASFLINAWEGAVMRAKAEKGAAPLNEFMSVTFKKILT
ncbi:TetR family transcriptional regulator C-terminal domain-containing protein [Enhydrobacter aerosaccus]|uniref:TetR family transcriptional regulator C-terminal domain-containing protein n=1 Tax=Enhydrobacter aerosaccus TaxID=225324 RepID=UPI001E499E5A|nr:TetR family transcriptional regulator C-terminal domain-containing protein [Enhydrobacter aerosaccus]